jgi:hypothetical protein
MTLGDLTSGRASALPDLPFRVYDTGRSVGRGRK